MFSQNIGEVGGAWIRNECSISLLLRWLYYSDVMSKHFEPPLKGKTFMTVLERVKIVCPPSSPQYLIAPLIKHSLSGKKLNTTCLFDMSTEHPRAIWSWLLCTFHALSNEFRHVLLFFSHDLLGDTFQLHTNCTQRAVSRPFLVFTKGVGPTVYTYLIYTNSVTK